MKKLLLLLLPLLLSFLLFQMMALDGKKPLDYNFSHQKHVVEQELECVDCHLNVEKSIAGTDNLMPTMAICNDCHEGDGVKLDNPETLPKIESYSVKFSHKQHLESGADCMTCHQSVIERVAFANYQLPTMVECMDCHENKAVTLACGSCHQPFENLKPISHRPSFVHNHGNLARLAAMEVSAGMDCAACHKQSFCQDCHEGDNIARLSHPLNYEFTHALEAQGKDKNCVSCHSEPQFCVSCHVDNQVMPFNHTVGWVNNFPGDGGRHRVEAMNDLDNCIACHEQNADEFCAGCHNGQ